MVSSISKLRQRVNNRRYQWARFRALPRPYRQLFWQTVVLLPTVGLALRCFRFQRVQGWLLSSSASRVKGNLEAACAPNLLPEGSDVDQLPELVHVARLSVLYTTRLYRKRFTCLPQSLVLWWLLRRRGFTPELRLGVRHLDTQFEAHAWVEYEGRSLELSTSSETPFMPFSRAVGEELIVVSPSSLNSPQ